MKIYSLFNSKFGAYNLPILFLNDAAACLELRKALLADKSSVLYDDLKIVDLYCIGSFDPSTGVVTGHDPVFVKHASDLVDDVFEGGVS